MIYLDYNATTPCDKEVLQAMTPYFTEKFGNASSASHAYGWAADEIVKISRHRIASSVQSDFSEIIFTSGATEACNLAIKGVFELYTSKGNHIITCKTEHQAVLDTCKHLEKKGACVTYLDVDEHGNIDLQILEQSIRANTILIAIMYANNETGVLHPIQQIGDIAKKHQVIFFSDATQALGKTEINVHKLQVDLMAISGHKVYGPKGIGALYLRRKQPRVRIQAQIHGGGQEKEFRSGTLNVPAIVGFGKACEIASNRLTTDRHHYTLLRQQLEQGLLLLPGAVLNGNKQERLPNTLNISFEGIKAERLLHALHHRIAFSLGSACASSLQRSSSHVLEAMNLSPDRIASSIRLSIGRHNTLDEIKETINQISDAINKIST